MFRPSAAVLALAAAGVLGSCVHVPTEKERQGADAHYDLGINAQNAGDVRSALKEFEQALDLDPDFAEAHNAIAVLLHLSFDKKDDAEKHYKRALEIRPAFSEAKVNLGNLYLDEGRLDEAIALYEQALNDMLYATPYIAETNLGWAYFKKGNTAQALEHLKAAVTTNPGFCLGYKDLGMVHDARGDLTAACTEFAKFVDACPKAAEAYQLRGNCQVRQGRAAEARASFDACVENAVGAAQSRLREDCTRLRDQLGGQGARP
ncbi:MAG TPA: social motility TPR repeat lipoprotein Tgl [Myxococcaceae bacterium]|nr:social motility TPR repeat lipoprotein Tgl [Myxococcaceae bacterium]